MREKILLERIGEPAMLEQLAEECTELGKAALKLARIHRGENPTPVTLEQAQADLLEEYTDVVQCGEELGLVPNCQQMEDKTQRFLKRWWEVNHENK